MATTEKYLQQLQTDKSNLIAKYNEKGLTLDESATFTDLANEFDNLPSGGDMSEYYSTTLQYGSIGKTDLTTNTPGVLKSITKLPDFELTGTSMGYALCNLPNMIEAPYVDTSECTSFVCAFANDTNLKSMPKYDTSKVTEFNYAFYMCESLEALPDFDYSACSGFNMIFAGCSSLKNFKLGPINSIKTVSFTNVFNACSSLTSLDLENVDLSSSTNHKNITYKCTSLIDYKPPKNMGKGYTRKTANYSSYANDYSTATSLSHDSLMRIINDIYDLNLTYNVAGGGTLYSQQLILGATNLAKLTADEIAIATNKGWAVS